MCNIVVNVEDCNSDARFKCDDKKKNIFLIGDSIRIGYCDTVKKLLADSAEVFYVDENCRSTQYVICSLQFWANMFSNPNLVDIVHFNCGHWDVAHWYGGKLPLTSSDEYKRNIKIIIEMLRKLFPNAKIIFATTTAMNPDGTIGENPRTNSEIGHYNDIAKSVSLENDVAINDLFEVTKDWQSENYADYCHFTTESFANLGKAVAEKLKYYYI